MRPVDGAGENAFAVRTLNTWSRGPDHAGRLRRIAHKIHAEVPDNVGLISVQEVVRPIHLPWAKDGAARLAGYLQELYGGPVAHCSRGDVGIVAGPEFEITAHRAWLLGRDSWLHDPLSIPYRRYLLEGELRHVALGRRLRFYATHLSHGAQESQRARQTERLLSLIQRRAAPGELLPLLAGDFNAIAGSACFRQIETHFELLHADSVDAIWAGRASSFPSSAGSYAVRKTSLMNLTSEGLCDSHESPSVALEIRI
ncbi:MAG TPA: hypothetical protein VG845_12290 [Dehalococcoidia bacterium]|nr:hypothetical protein [Dehalococcoidia bacterium]